ncbi:hypothetical protein LDL08_12150 [Nonomuraea glycinis]|uniref:Uncharacterized protein n=1 Tax=Nonomuraea glycinis TaxID=2047744 RepID=A0A918A0H5_9ACTN|nr:hypothetical protein [Nonomuraea glycinis]MCA2176937.1 hypothetical protein [Nonomuraea glycinis]GGP03009.1 hypothetical protein GCM10012278_12510 [Nonomuraea glycinis]
MVGVLHGRRRSSRTFAVLLAAYVWRLVAYPRRALADARGPGRAFGYFSLVAAPNVLGIRLALDHHLAVGFWGIGVILYLMLTGVRCSCVHFDHRCTQHAGTLTPILRRYQDRRQAESDRLSPPAISVARAGPIGLLRDLQDLYQLAHLVDITWVLVGQAAAGARDRALLNVVATCVATCGPDITARLAWLRGRMKAAAPQTLLVAS